MVIQKKSSLTKKKIILCFIKYYLPGYKSGGPVRSISNFVEKFGDEYDIRIVCSSHDALDYKPYKNIIIEQWNTVGKAKVFYVSNRVMKFKKIFNLLCDTEYDIIYLNSFFTFTFSIFPLIVQYLRFINLKSCIIAPRGEFARNAIKLKKYKKFFYLYIVKKIGLYNNLCWQASSELESTDIRRELKNVARNIYIAPDLNSLNLSPRDEVSYQKKDILKAVFLSRISPMKNLDFLLKVLNDVSHPLELDILGPKEDINYWERCKKILAKLPTHIKVNIGNEIFHEKVTETFKNYDLFVFPTRGENFGHVIPECLSVGTPILLSDKTPWEDDPSHGLQVIPLDKHEWVKAIDEFANLTFDKALKRRKAAINYFNIIKLKNKKSIIQNELLFEYKSSCLN